MGIPSFVDFEYTRAQCRHYRDVARVFANPQDILNTLRLPAGTTAAEALDHLWMNGARGNHAGTEGVDFQLSPNPARSQVRLTTQQTGPVTYRCLDPLGRQVTTGTFEERTHIVARDWLPGLYTIEVQNASGNPTTKRLVVTR